MIRELILTNFQGHQDNRFHLEPGINVITGRSDSGKSSVIRALFWLIKNRPTGASDIFRNHLVGEKEPISVGVELEDGTSVIRFRDSKANGYMIDALVLKAIRQDVPSEVSDLLNIGDPTIQPQHDSYFLLADSPGDVARKLNEVCGLDIIDGTLKTANLLITRNGQAIKVSEASIEQIKADIDAYYDLEGREKALGTLERKQGHLADTKDRIKRLTALLGDKERLESDIVDVNGLLGAESEVDALLVKINEQQAVKERITRLESLINESTRLDKEIDGKDAALGELEASLHSLLDGLDVCPLCSQSIPKEQYA